MGYLLKIKKAYWIIPICLFFVLFSRNVSALEDFSDYQAQIINSARSQKLYDDRYWNILMHYRPIVGGRESLIDDPNFFLASDGKKNPESELITTIGAFFTPFFSGESHPRCRFPARYAWLKKSLGIDEKRLPSISCPDIQETLKKINPKSSVLIFASPYLSSSSTMFGHTSIRIDSGNEDHLLSSAVNYAAHSTDEVGPSFVFKGLTGGFKGYFSMLPYYVKIKEYSDLENRDIWEYYLDLNEEETYQMVLHILELRDIYSEYYFFDENCSFNILFLLEAGRPSLHLVDYYWNRWGYGVIPLDTVDIVCRSGIVTRLLYRPSPVTQIRHLASQLDKDQQRIAKSIAIHGLPSDKMDSLEVSTEQKHRTLELAIEYLKYRYSRMELTQEEFQEQFLRLAGAKKNLAGDSKTLIDIQVPEPPESNHKPVRLDLGFGYREDSFFGEVTFRPAYRDLLELGDSHYDASQLKLLEISGRYYEKGSTFKLQEATIFNIISLSTRDIFFHPFSWKLLTGFEQNLFPNGDEDVVFRLNTGGGWSISNSIRGLFYALIEADMKLSNRFNDNIAFGPGATLGFLKKVTENWSIGIQGQGIFYELGEDYKLYRCEFDQRYEITKKVAFLFNLGIEKAATETRTELKIALSYYF